MIIEIKGKKLKFSKVKLRKLARRYNADNIVKVNDDIYKIPLPDPFCIEGGETGCDGCPFGSLVSKRDRLGCLEFRLWVLGKEPVFIEFYDEIIIYAEDLDKAKEQFATINKVIKGWLDVS